MFTPAATKEMIMDFVIETVELAGANPCPPMVVGVGIGGDFEECALLAKTALCRSSDLRNPDPLYAQMEEELLRPVANETNVELGLWRQYNGIMREYRDLWYAYCWASSGG